MPLPLIPAAMAAAGPALLAGRVAATRATPNIVRGIQALFDKPSQPAGFTEAVNQKALRVGAELAPGLAGALKDAKNALTGKSPKKRRRANTKRNRVVAQMQGKQQQQAPQAPMLAQEGVRPLPIDVPTGRPRAATS